MKLQPVRRPDQTARDNSDSVGHKANPSARFARSRSKANKKESGESNFQQSSAVARHTRRTLPLLQMIYKCERVPGYRSTSVRRRRSVFVTSKSKSGTSVPYGKHQS